MPTTAALHSNLEWLNTTISFFKKHFIVILSLGLIAGTGRVIQLGGFGEISPSMNVIMEVVVEFARLVMFIYILGAANLQAGFSRLIRIFKPGFNRKSKIVKAIGKIRRQWPALLLNFCVYLVIAWVINILIDKLAYETCLHLNLQKGGILNTNASEWTIILFFKNLTVIPLTFIFNTVLLFYLTDRLRTMQVKEQAGIA